MAASLDDPMMAEFVRRLAEINAQADQAPGFVWRLQTPQGDATALRVYDDNLLLINMSVWESVDALYLYTYYSPHIEVFRQRSQWFGKLAAPALGLWWLPAGHIPTPEEAKRRLNYLQEHGPTPYAFTFKQRYTAEEMLTYTASPDIPTIE
jgi:hypothetical protein